MAALLLGLILLGTGQAQASPDLGAKNNFILRCTGCHGQDGSGSLAGGIPDFRGFVASFSFTPAGRLYLMHVPGVVSASLDNREIAAVMNYVMHEWGGDSFHARQYTPFTEQEVASLQQQEVKDVVKLRREVVKDLQAQGLPVAPYPWP
ncbi:hypothetical protein QCD60_07205 [Pokkaliibacter sp. MBI-7]|uniref:c-type cytochrome n=1 Tax=Pokkaliibacter sp. MBI-7 TaxID=3040600 RepID=UPI00244B07AB|nr:hypothetical protein [Pokkaliibacter sp. MBI-7]MDH2432347.1 hypothetical protein [Pokkaliibacter sp. MBI-7]